MGHYNSFLVRVWTENGEDTPRGYIQHVGSQESMHFRGWETLVGFIQDHLTWRINGDVSEGVEQPLAIPQGDEPSLWEQF